MEPAKQQPGKPKVIQGTKATAKKSAALEAEEGAPPWEGGGLVSKTAGKVFFEVDGTPFVCSANVVPAKNKSLVSTAGHCVNDAHEQPAGTPGENVENFVFVPGYDGKLPEGEQAPYGVWPAKSITSHTLWAANRESEEYPGYSTELWNYDVGFAVLAPQGGQNIQEVTGAQSIAFNQPRGKFVGAFGYPAEDPYDGTTLRYCAGEPFDDPSDEPTNDQGLDCGLNGGASGGPWFQDFDDSTGVGTQISVNSFTYLDDSGDRLGQMFGPYFGTSIQRFYEAVAD